MAERLPNSVYQAINREMTPEFNRWAKKTYGMTGKRLVAKTYAVEGGGSIDEGTSATSYQGARGPGQFIASTRDAYVRQYGVDPWKNDRSAVRGTMIHLKGTGVAGYNPGMPEYEGMVLGAKVDTGPLRTGSVSYRRDSGSRMITRRTAGVDNSDLRQSLKLDYLANRYDPDALLNLGLALRGAEDVPGRTVTTPGAPVRAGDGSDVGAMLRKAAAWDRARVPYQWGGGHASIAKPGQPVDCSGYVSAVLGLETPLVSGDLARWGKPGKGRNVTVYANDGHVLMQIGNRWFGTSKSNPGGGAGEISKPSASYLSRFVARHPG